jgi:hypothetical protein
MAATNVTTEGRADAIRSGSHTSRSQWAHQVTAAALFLIRNEAFTAYKEEIAADHLDVKSFDVWCVVCCYGTTILVLEQSCQIPPIREITIS